MKKIAFVTGMTGQDGPYLAAHLKFIRIPYGKYAKLLSELLADKLIII